jgi:hypothetical protein
MATQVVMLRTVIFFERACNQGGPAHEWKSMNQPDASGGFERRNVAAAFGPVPE